MAGDIVGTTRVRAYLSKGLDATVVWRWSLTLYGPAEPNDRVTVTDATPNGWLNRCNAILMMQLWLTRLGLEEFNVEDEGRQIRLSQIRRIDTMTEQTTDQPAGITAAEMEAIQVETPAGQVDPTAFTPGSDDHVAAWGCQGPYQMTGEYADGFGAYPESSSDACPWAVIGDAAPTFDVICRRRWIQGYIDHAMLDGAIGNPTEEQIMATAAALPGELRAIAGLDCPPDAETAILDRDAPTPIARVRRAQEHLGALRQLVAGEDVREHFAGQIGTDTHDALQDLLQRVGKILEPCAGRL